MLFFPHADISTNDSLPSTVPTHYSVGQCQHAPPLCHNCPPRITNDKSQITAMIFHRCISCYLMKCQSGLIVTHSTTVMNTLIQPGYLWVMNTIRTISQIRVILWVYSTVVIDRLCSPISAWQCQKGCVKRFSLFQHCTLEHGSPQHLICTPAS
jgi:hypothetical protein